MKGSQNLPEKLKEYRKKNHYSQEQVAEYMNLSRQAISNWETGKAYPDLDNLVMLSELYGITVDELLGEGSKTRNTSHNDDLKTISYNVILEILALSIILILSLDFFMGGIIATILIIYGLKRAKRNYFIIYIICVVCLLLEIYDLMIFIFHINSYFSANALFLK